MSSVEAPSRYSAVRAVGMHGHMYQPDRESADGHIYGEQKDVAKEYGEGNRWQNWNDVLTALCYEPNASMGNFQRISFDMFPDIANYLRRNNQEVYEEIVATPRLLKGTGEPANVLGNPYFHAILPSMPERDQRTLINWGKYDTERRFGVSPKGIWLPEMAMNSDTLGIARDAGYRWTYGFPWQLEGATGTPTAYEVQAGDKGKMIILPDTSHGYEWGGFYDGDAPRFYDDIWSRMTGEKLPQIALKATDIEHLQGEMPLRLKYASENATGMVRWKTPAAFIADTGIMDGCVEIPQTRIVENSAGEGTTDRNYTQTHSLERWTGVRDGEVTVPWKNELQGAYKGFAKAVDKVFEDKLGELGIKQPWEMRDDYIRLVEGEVSVREFFDFWDSQRNLTADGREQTLKLLAAEYHKLAASSSCAWFFDDPTGREPKIAARQMRIALEYIRTSGMEDAETLAKSIEADLLERLRKVADEKGRLSNIYRGIGVTSVRNLVVPGIR